MLIYAPEYGPSNQSRIAKAEKPNMLATLIMPLTTNGLVLLPALVSYGLLQVNLSDFLPI